MKTFTISLIMAMSLATSSMAFSLPAVDSLDAKDAKLKACMLQEAQKALANGSLTKATVDKQATLIAETCATASAIKSNPETVQLAVTVINGLLK